MDILQSLKQLRDDIKTWVTNNLNALNAKIDEKTIPIDNELSSTSTNPVQNKIIKKAIDNIPKFSGDYNDLTNAPNISEDESGNMIIADESGNIIFKADVDGIHTTAVSLNGEAAASQKYVDEAIANADVDLTGYATEDFVTTTVDSAKVELSESIISESEDWKVVDNNGNIIFSIDNTGVHATTLTLNGEEAAVKTYVDEAIDDIEFPETDLTGYATEKYVDDAVGAIKFPESDLSNYYTKEQTDEAIKTAKEEISETITSESNEWKVVDNAGNIIFSVDASGAHTTELTLNDKAAATEEYVDEAIAAIPKVSLDGYATENYVDTKVADLGAGDMLKSVYDVDNDGIVDKAKALNIEDVGNRDIDDIIEPGVYYYLPYDEDHPQSVHWPDPENHEGFLEVFGRQDDYSDALIQKVVSFDSFAHEPKIRIYWRSILGIERHLWKGWQREELDYNDLINKPTIPTKTSELINDKKFITIRDLDY